MKVLAFANHAPDQVLAYLRQLKAVTKRSDILFLEGGAELPDKCTSKFVFLLSATGLDTYEGRTHTFFVFDDPIRLSRFTVPVVDIECAKVFHKDGFLLKQDLNFSLPAKDVKVTKQKFDIVATCSDGVKCQKTFLNQFMTFVYSMPSGSHQKPIKKMVCKWMASKEPLSTFMRRLRSTGGDMPMSEKQYRRMEELLSSEVALIYRQAMQEKGDEDEVAERLQISAYELRYIRAINKAEK